MFSALLSSALLIAASTTPSKGTGSGNKVDKPPPSRIDTGHSSHAQAPNVPDAALLAAIKALARADQSYVDARKFKRAMKRWNRQCKHWKRSGDLRRPIRCEAARLELLAQADALPQPRPAPSLTRAQHRQREASALLARTKKRAESFKKPNMARTAEEVQRRLAEALAIAAKNRVAADAVRTRARETMVGNTPDATLAAQAISAEKDAYDAEATAADTKLNARDFAVYRAVEVAQEATEAAARAVGNSSTDAELVAESALADAVVADATAAEAAEPQTATGTKETEPEDEPEEKTEAEKELDKLKAGKLIRWGITGGVAPAFYQPFNRAQNAASVPGMGALTYVLFLPGFWRNRPEQNIYCANRWTGTENEAAAARAADDLAIERAKIIVDRLLASEKSGALKPGGAPTEIMCTDGRCLRDEDAVRVLAGKVNAGGDDAEAARTTLTAIVQRSTFDWTSGISASCRSRMWGLWFGYPLKYTATVPRAVMTASGEQIRRDRLDVQPIFATGLGFSPNAYVSLLAGVSIGKVNLPPAKDQDDEVIVSFLFGLGGNLDLLGFLTK